MLLPIKEKTPRCAIFQGLNDEVLHFLRSSIAATQFTKYLLSERLRDALWKNEPTKNQFHCLWNELKPLSTEERRDILNEYSQKQFVQHFYEDTGYQLPAIPEAVYEALGKLCIHLFARSSALASVRNSCGETLHESFGKFRTFNKNICCFCGSSELAQVRAGTEENEQWRAANDHLLSKDEYPIYAVHPDNLVPLCETCNSKAKLAKDLLNQKRKGHPDIRRLCLFPFTESCHENVGVILEQGQLGIHAKFIISTETPEITEKIDTWNDVYQIENRVEGKFIDLITLVDSDCYADDFDGFKQKIIDKSISCERYVRLEGWSFWKYKLYEWLHNYGNEIVDQLWESIQDKRSDSDAAFTYGI